MIRTATLLHLRIPFSFFLMPVFLFAVSVSPQLDLFNLILSFLILHLFIYPASNGFNSYYDKDEDSIGGLEKPPPVSKELLYVSLILDAAALLLSLLISWQFMVMMFVFGMVSKAYSHDKIRLKKYPVVSWLVASGFQGAFTFLSVILALNEFDFIALINWQFLFPALLSTMLLMGFYPMTQIYQHREDARRGDNTISRLLGIKGTFIFTAIVFLTADIFFFLYFNSYFSLRYFLLFQAFLLVPVLYFLIWFYRYIKNGASVDYKHAMMLNFISSGSMNAFFILLGILLH